MHLQLMRPLWCLVALLPIMSTSACSETRSPSFVDTLKLLPNAYQLRVPGVGIGKNIAGLAIPSSLALADLLREFDHDLEYEHVDGVDVWGWGDESWQIREHESIEAQVPNCDGQNLVGLSGQTVRHTRGELYETIRGARVVTATWLLAVADGREVRLLNINLIARAMTGSSSRNVALSACRLLDREARELHHRLVTTDEVIEFRSRLAGQTLSATVSSTNDRVYRLDGLPDSRRIASQVSVHARGPTGTAVQHFNFLEPDGGSGHLIECWSGDDVIYSSSTNPELWAEVGSPSDCPLTLPRP